MYDIFGNKRNVCQSTVREHGIGRERQAESVGPELALAFGRGGTINIKSLLSV